MGQWGETTAFQYHRAVAPGWMLLLDTDASRPAALSGTDGETCVHHLLMVLRDRCSSRTTNV